MNGLLYLMYNSALEISIGWDKMITGLSEPARLVNVDNASTDNCVDILTRAGYIVDVNEENVGFTAGINQGIRQLLDYEVEGWIFIINPDVICLDNWDISLTEPLCKNPRCGIVGAKLVSPNGNISHSGGKIVAEKSLMKWPIAYSVGYGKNVVVEEAFCTTTFIADTEDFSEPKRSAWVSFSVVALNVDMVRDIGLLDESYFLYGSDMDYCVRAWDRGWEVWSSPSGFTHLRHDTIQRAPRQVQRKAKHDMALFTSKEEELWPQLPEDLQPKMTLPSSR